jgi:hypothetical protein
MEAPAPLGAKDIVTLNGRLQGVSGPKGSGDPVRPYGRRSAVPRSDAQRLEKLWESGKLKKMFPQTAAGQKAYSDAGALLRGKMDALLEFGPIKRF